VDKEARRRQSEADKAFHIENHIRNIASYTGWWYNRYFINGVRQLNLGSSFHKIKNNQKRHNPPNVKR